MRISLREMAAMLLALAPAATMWADTSFAYQGLLLDEKGRLLSEPNHSIVFRIYGQASGGEPLWASTNSVSLNEKGLFSVELSGNAVSGESLSSLLLANASKALYIGLTVDNDAGEIAPRQKLLSVPKAFRAANCVAAKNGFSVSNTLSGASATIDGSVTAGSLRVRENLSCGSLNASSMAVTNGNLWVRGKVIGRGVIPVGGIVVWSGAANQIPYGWALCNGQNGTPNLLDRFVVGAGNNYKVNDQGGNATYALKLAEMPSHTHKFVFSGADIDADWQEKDHFFCQHNKYPSFRHEANTLAAGGGAAHENRPPYYALCYIMRIR